MTPLVQNVTDLLSLGTVLLDLLIIFLIVTLITPFKNQSWGKDVRFFFGEYAFLFAFLVSFGSALGSLFYSVVAHFQPCFLCWIQRAFLYTQAIIFFVAMLAKKDEYVKKYSRFVSHAGLILSALGGIVSAYHAYIQFGGTSFVDCAATGVSCEFIYFIEYGYVTIPTMALTASLAIIVFLFCKQSLSKSQ